MKKTISLLLAFSFAVTSACYGYGPDSLRPVSSGITIRRQGSDEWFAGKASSAGQRMDRREFLKALAVGAASISVPGAAQKEVLAGPADKPLAFTGIVYQAFESANHGCWGS